jgi:hypothetical protein
MEFEDTPLFDWLKKNRLFLLVLLVGILAIAANERFGPAIRNSAIAKSWDLFQTVTADLNLDENLSSSLQLARDDERIFPWFVFGATKAALLQRNMNALQILRPELEGLQSGDAANLKIASPAGAMSIASFLLERVDEMEAGNTKTFTNPEPTGAAVKFVVTDSLETTYEFTVGTYEDAAPGATELFLTAVEAGTFNTMPLTGFGGRTLKLEGLGAESSPPLERDFGYFHLAGALSTIQKPGEPGEQETDAIQILLEDNTFADGQATVFATITSGMDELKTAITSSDPEVTFTVTSATIL